MPAAPFSTLRRCCLLAPLLAGLPRALRAAPARDPVPIGEALPEALMSGLNGPDRRLSSYRGQRLLINVWASWCGPCRAEAASLERFVWSEAGAKLAVIGISTDDDRRAAERWLRSSNATISHFIDHALELETMLGASRLPLTVLVDERGRVVARITGAREWDGAEMAGTVAQAFAAAKAR